MELNEVIKKYNGILYALIDQLAPQMGLRYAEQLVNILVEIEEMIEEDGGNE